MSCSFYFAISYRIINAPRVQCECASLLVEFYDQEAPTGLKSEFFSETRNSNYPRLIADVVRDVGLLVKGHMKNGIIFKHALKKFSRSCWICYVIHFCIFWRRNLENSNRIQLLYINAEFVTSMRVVKYMYNSL